MKFNIHKCKDGIFHCSGAFRFLELFTQFLKTIASQDLISHQMIMCRHWAAYMCDCRRQAFTWQPLWWGALALDRWSLYTLAPGLIQAVRKKTAGLHVGYGLVEVSNDVASLVVCTQIIFLGGAGFLWVTS